MSATTGGAVAPVDALAGLGPKSRAMLARAGVASADELRRVGAVAAFVRARRANGGVSLNLLWGLEGALTGARWQHVARRHRTSLLLAVDDYERANPAGPLTTGPASPSARRGAASRSRP